MYDGKRAILCGMRTVNGIVSVTAASVLALTGGVVAHAEPAPAPADVPAAEQPAPDLVPAHDGQGYVPAEAPVVDAPEAEVPEADAEAAPAAMDPEQQVQLQKDLADATVEHLTQQGHHFDEDAQAIASEWAQEAATGQVEFVGGVGQGTTHLDEGIGNIYKLTPQEAEARYEWLQSREANPFDDGHAFGVGASSDGEYFYVAEFFAN